MNQHYDIYQDMVDQVDRLLLLVTGPHAAPLGSDRAEGALEAIEVMTKLESLLKISASLPLPVSQSELLERVLRRAEVLQQLTPLFDALAAKGILR